ncbi:porin [Bradyrhizobium sp. CCBAU 51753]|uniref:porin n=1 Tax=Bradyrhizobium sp. CCBAU 51753 TaxID=1325100 RepID=UPI00188B9F89|nr:porin [Bradyrhizobium sp. CCBAU 51753]QOZ23833.1 porin [Bradyrhizobium sp. CCBAU 51753]
MKMLKDLLLGSATGLIALGGAQAADLPVKAKAVEYVKICSLYGAGFYYIPGTDTCIKLGGYLRTDVVVNTNTDNTGNLSGQGGAKNRYTNAYTWRSREDLNIDTRTATEYGVVRTFFDGVFTWTSGSYTGNGNGTTTYAGDGIAGGSLGVYYAFIQFAGFTMGKAISQFSAPWTNYPGNNFDGLVGGGGTVTGVNQFTYTADFGQGVTATISAQDPVQYYQAGVNNLAVPGTFGYGTSDYAGTIVPDFIAMIRVNQTWGLFQASVAAHDNHVAYYSPAGVELNGHPGDKWGWAGQLALSIKNIPTGAGDTINVQGVYTNGATRYNIQDLSQGGAATLFGNTGRPGAYQSIGYGFAPDSVFTTGGSQQLISTWGFNGAYTHNWDPYWNTSIYGAYAAVSYNSTSKTLMCGPVGTIPALFGASITTCNPDYNIAQLGVITRWTPVRNLTFSADLTWSHLDQKYAGTITTSSVAVGKPLAVYELKDQSNLLLLLRAQRNW